MIDSSVASVRGRSAVRRPSHITRMRSQTASSSGNSLLVIRTERPRSASVRTVTPAEVIAFSPEGLKNASGSLQVAFGRAMVRQLVQRLFKANDRYVAAVRAKAVIPP